MREKVKYPHFFKLIEREKNFCRLVVRDDEFNFQFSFMEPSHWTAHPLSTLSLCMKFQLWIFNKVSISWLTLSRSSSPFVNLRHEKWVLKRELPPSVRKFALGSPLDGVVMCVWKLRLIQFFFLLCWATFSHAAAVQRVFPPLDGMNYWDISRQPNAIGSAHFRAGDSSACLDVIATWNLFWCWCFWHIHIKKMKQFFHSLAARVCLTRSKIDCRLHDQVT